MKVTFWWMMIGISLLLFSNAYSQDKTRPLFNIYNCTSEAEDSDTDRNLRSAQIFSTVEGDQMMLAMRFDRPMVIFGGNSMALNVVPEYTNNSAGGFETLKLFYGGMMLMSLSATKDKDQLAGSFTWDSVTVPVKCKISILDDNNLP